MNNKKIKGDDIMNKKERNYFERYKKENISSSELREAKQKATFLGELAEKFLLLIKMVEAVFRGEYELDIFNVMMIIGAIVYVVSPLDAIPDFLLGLGYLDDISVVAFVLNRLDVEIRNFENTEGGDK